MRSTFCITIGLFLFLPMTALAIAPPDLVVSLGAQIISIGSLLILLFSTALGACFIFFEQSWKYILQRSWLLWLLVVLVLIVYSAYFVSQNTDHDVDGEPQTSTNHQFFNDTILLFSDTGDEPFILYIDANRKAVSTNEYLHYYFVEGLSAAGPLSEYQQQVIGNKRISAFGVLDEFQKELAPDLSVRHAYEGSVSFGKNKHLFFTDQLQSDFVTRSDINQTRHHSVATATLAIDSSVKTVYAYTENMHGADYRDLIFFIDRERVEAITHQFILWDEAGNFYAVDDTVVATAHPDYTSHTWVLYKEAQTGMTKKAFTASVLNEPGGVQISVPELSGDSLQLAYVQQLPVSITDRELWYVQGVVTTNEGVKKISGIARIQR